MRIALCSDLHANLPATEAVLADVDEQNMDEIWFLGDNVGYGANPDEVVRLVAKHGDLVLGGNHDAVVTGRFPMHYFPGEIGIAAEHAQLMLEDENLRWIARLPAQQQRHDIAAWHASWDEPWWEFLSAETDARRHFRILPTDIGVFGHTHEPVMWRLKPDTGALNKIVPKANTTYRTDGFHCLINPGSVGQPNYRQQGAWWALLDTDAQTVQWHQLDYDIDLAQANVLSMGLPFGLAERLENMRVISW